MPGWSQGGRRPLICRKANSVSARRRRPRYGRQARCRVARACRSRCPSCDSLARFPDAQNALISSSQDFAALICGSERRPACRRLRPAAQMNTEKKIPIRFAWLIVTARTALGSSNFCHLLCCRRAARLVCSGRRSVSLMLLNPSTRSDRADERRCLLLDVAPESAGDGAVRHLTPSRRNDLDPTAFEVLAGDVEQALLAQILRDQIAR